MVAEVAELRAAKLILDLERRRAVAAGQALPERIEVGAMMEVPSLYWQLPTLLREIDFLSVGSNDLLQFLFACDRGSPVLGDRYDVLSPPALSFFRALVEQCRRDRSAEHPARAGDEDPHRGDSAPTEQQLDQVGPVLGSGPGLDVESSNALGFLPDLSRQHLDCDVPPEAVVVGKIGARSYAFVGLERIGGIMVYDITDPYAPEFQTYVNNRDFAGDAAAGAQARPGGCGDDTQPDAG